MPNAMAASTPSPSLDQQPWPGALGLSVGVATEDGAATITLGGDLDVASAPELSLVLARVLGDGCTEIFLDLTALELMDSAAIDLIARALPVIKQHGAHLVLRSPRPLIRRVLDLSGVSSLVSANAES
jgi:anti-sigma B factor antagonist